MRNSSSKQRSRLSGGFTWRCSTSRPKRDGQVKRIYDRFVSQVTRTDFVGQYIKVRLKEEVLEMAVVKPLFTPTGTKFRCFEVSTNLVFRLDLFNLLAKGCIFVCNKKLVS